MSEELKIVRDERGRIITRTGAVPGAGGKNQSDVERIRAMTRELLDPDTIAAWQKAMRKKLARGNSFAGQYVRDTLIGKPAVTTNVNVSADLQAFMAAWQAGGTLPQADAPPQIEDAPTEDDAASMVMSNSTDEGDEEVP